MISDSLVDYLQEQHKKLSPRQIKQSDLVQAGVLVALTDCAQPQVVLTRRAKHMNTHQGDIAFPGGKADLDDADIEQTALREAYEEVGIKASSVQLIGRLDQVVSKHGILVTPILGVIPADTPLSINEEELDAAFLTPLSVFRSPPESFFERGRMKVPNYDFGEYRIWGLTALIMVEMMNHFYQTEIPFRF